MKFGVFAILVTMIFSATITKANEIGESRLNPNDMAICMLENSISQAQFTRQLFPSFKTDAWYLKFFEGVSKLEYRVEKNAWISEPGTSCRKKALVTRFQISSKPIYLTFSFSQ